MKRIILMIVALAVLIMTFAVFSTAALGSPLPYDNGSIPENYGGGTSPGGGDPAQGGNNGGEGGGGGEPAEA